MPQLVMKDSRCDVKWSHDGSYLARLDVNKVDRTRIIKVYDTPSMKLNAGRSIRAPGAEEITWAPGQ